MIKLTNSPLRHPSASINNIGKEIMVPAKLLLTSSKEEIRIHLTSVFEKMNQQPKPHNKHSIRNIIMESFHDAPEITVTQSESNSDEFIVHINISSITKSMDQDKQEIEEQTINIGLEGTYNKTIKIMENNNGDCNSADAEIQEIKDRLSNIFQGKGCPLWFIKQEVSGKALSHYIKSPALLLQTDGKTLLTAKTRNGYTINFTITKEGHISIGESQKKLDNKPLAEVIAEIIANFTNLNSQRLDDLLAVLDNNLENNNIDISDNELKSAISNLEQVLKGNSLLLSEKSSVDDIAYGDRLHKLVFKLKKLLHSDASIRVDRQKIKQIVVKHFEIKDADSPAYTPGSLQHTRAIQEELKRTYPDIKSPTVICKAISNNGLSGRLFTVKITGVLPIIVQVEKGSAVILEDANIVSDLKGGGLFSIYFNPDDFKTHSAGHGMNGAIRLNDHQREKLKILIDQYAPLDIADMQELEKLKIKLWNDGETIKIINDAFHSSQYSDIQQNELFNQSNKLNIIKDQSQNPSQTIPDILGNDKKNLDTNPRSNLRTVNMSATAPSLQLKDMPRNVLQNILMFNSQKDVVKIASLSKGFKGVIKDGAVYSTYSVSNQENIAPFYGAIRNSSYLTPIIVTEENARYIIKNILLFQSISLVNLSYSTTLEFCQILKDQENVTKLSLRYLRLTTTQMEELIPYLINIKELDLSQNDIGAQGALAIANSSLMSNLASLNLSDNNIGVEGAVVIADSVHMCNLTSLNLNNNNIGVEGVIAIANSANMCNLTSLSLAGNNITTQGAIAIANSAYMCNLTKLDLHGNNIRNRGAMAIANPVYITNLTSLDLCYNNINAQGALAIANSSLMSNLTSLNLASNYIGAQGAKAIADSPLMSNLTSLNLANNRLKKEGAIAIANSPYMSNLTSLHLGDNDLKKEGAIAIANSPHMGNLTSLHLGDNDLKKEGAKAIADSSLMPNLTILNLDSNRLKKEGAIAIANSPYMGSLTYLDLCNSWLLFPLSLSDSGIGNEGAIAIANSVYMHNLTRLNLRCNYIKKEGAIAIANSVHMRNLASLNLYENRIGKEGAKAIANSINLIGCRKFC